MAYTGIDARGVGRGYPIRVADVAVAVFVLSAIAAEDGSLPSQLGRVVLVLAAIGEVATKSIRPSLVYVWQAVFVAFVFCSVLWAYSPERAGTMALTVLVNAICLVALTYLVVGDPMRLKVALICMMIGPLLLMLRVGLSDGFLVYLGARYAENANANSVGMAAGLGFGLAYVSFVRRVLIRRWLAAALIPANLAVALLSASRKAILMLALVVFLFALLSQHRSGASRFFRVAVAGSVGLAGYFLIMNIAPLYAIVGYRVETMMNGLFGGSGDVDSSTTTRLLLIDRGVAWFRANPWIGYGADNFKALMADYFPQASAYYAHNNFVEILVDYGLVGFVLFYGMYLSIIVWGLLRLAKLNSVQSMILSMMITLLVIEYGAVDYYDSALMSFVVLSWVCLRMNSPVADKVGVQLLPDGRNSRIVSAGVINASA